jgi:hypothetical protein
MTRYGCDCIDCQVVAEVAERLHSRRSPPCFCGHELLAHNMAGCHLCGCEKFADARGPDLEQPLADSVRILRDGPTPDELRDLLDDATALRDSLRRGTYARTRADVMRGKLRLLVIQAQRAGRSHSAGCGRNTDPEAPCVCFGVEPPR